MSWVQQVVTRPPLDPLAGVSPSLFDEPIEALAGKGWQQMAREAAQRQEEEIAERVRSLWRTPAAPKPPPFSLASLVGPALTGHLETRPAGACLPHAAHGLHGACQLANCVPHVQNDAEGHSA